MQNFLFLIVLVIINSTLILAQVPQAINYQGIVRDSNGDPISNATVNLRFTIREANPTGSIVFQEFHITSTNVYGLINLPIGQGSATQGFFNQISWESNTHYLQIEAHPGSPPYVDLGTTQFLSVPYSQHSSTADHANNGIPAGFIGTWAGPNPPAGWLICDGSAISRTTYANLFTAIGNAWGAGNGATTFHLPDLRGRFLRGVDQGAGNDPDTASRYSLQLLGSNGNNVGSYQDDAFQDHQHQSNGQHNVFGLSGPNAAQAGFNGGTVSFSSLVSLSSRIPNNKTSSESRPKNANVFYIIKY